MIVQNFETNFEFRERRPCWRLKWIGGESWHNSEGAARVALKQLALIRYNFPLTREPTMAERRKWYEKYRFTIAENCLFLNGKIYAEIEHICL